MPTNDEIIKKNLLWHHNFPLDDIRKAMNDARADEREKAIVKAAEKAGKHAFIPATNDEIINLLKQPNSQLTMTTKTLQEMLKDEGNKARADTLRFAISHMRVARSNMCLKDRAILLNEINLLEIELKKLEE
jgi:DNA-binding transcriptional MerR regulator